MHVDTRSVRQDGDSRRWPHVAAALSSLCDQAPAAPAPAARWKQARTIRGYRPKTWRARRLGHVVQVASLRLCAREVERAYRQNMEAREWCLSMLDRLQGPIDEMLASASDVESLSEVFWACRELRQEVSEQLLGLREDAHRYRDELDHALKLERLLASRMRNTIPRRRPQGLFTARSVSTRPVRRCARNRTAHRTGRSPVVSASKTSGGGGDGGGDPPEPPTRRRRPSREVAL